VAAVPARTGVGFGYEPWRRRARPRAVPVGGAPQPRNERSFFDVHLGTMKKARKKKAQEERQAAEAALAERREQRMHAMALQDRARPALRFQVHDKVLCKFGRDGSRARARGRSDLPPGWVKAEVVQLWYRERGCPEPVPYQCKLEDDSGECVIEEMCSGTAKLSTPSQMLSMGFCRCVCGLRLRGVRWSFVGVLKARQPPKAFVTDMQLGRRPHLLSRRLR